MLIQLLARTTQQGCQLPISRVLLDIQLEESQSLMPAGCKAGWLRQRLSTGGDDWGRSLSNPDIAPDVVGEFLVGGQPQ